MNHDPERKIYQLFLEHWNEDSLENDLVFLRVNEIAPAIVHRWGWGDHVDDIIQSALLQLARAEYRGDGSLDGYIRHIIINEIRHLWRKEGRKRRSEMPADLEDKRNFASEIEAKLSDRSKRLLKRVPQGHQWFIEAIIAADRYLSQRDAAAIGKVKRSEVEKLLKELRQIWKSMEEEEEEKRSKAKKAGE